jgi:hypothetical protein
MQTHGSRQDSPFGETSVDLLLVCGARPDLISRTLESFSRRVIPNFGIARVFANIDRFQGGTAEVAAVQERVLAFFPAAEIRTPESPSFTKAVAWLWGCIASPYALHLEDDWLAHADIGEGDVLPYFNGPVRQVSILTVEKNWKSRYPFHCAWERRRFLGVEFGRRLYPDRPLFTTSPSFVEREFARTCSRLMDPSLDPEKQLYDNRNVALSSYTSSFQNRIIGGRNPYWIEDIGRADRDRRGTRKVIAGGQSHWIGNEAADRTEQ